MKKDNIPQLVELSQNGDSGAFEILFTTFKTRLHHSLFKILNDTKTNIVINKKVKIK